MMQNQNCSAQGLRPQMRQSMQYPKERRVCEDRRTAECTCCEEKLSCECLMKRITLSGFAMVDANLYLDTHPGDTEAISYFNEQSRIYNEALSEYSQRFGPLTIAHAHHNDRYWDWVNQPWPWQ